MNTDNLIDPSKIAGIELRVGGEAFSVLMA
jgi:hypothetical protein